MLAEDAGLEELLALYKHDHAKVKGLASAALAHLTSNGILLPPWPCIPRTFLRRFFRM